jgi:hypothetical protein
MSQSNQLYEIFNSPVHGKGVRASKDIDQDKVIGEALCKIKDTGSPDLDYNRTELGKFTNHSNDPNLSIKKHNLKYYFISNSKINNGSELTVNYNDFDFEGERGFTKDDAMDKKAYFQGTEEPKPKEKQYKSDKAILVQPRFKEPLYKNYDIYDVPGVDGKTNKLGPGSGYHSLMKYKSVSDFLKDKRKHMKDKYKADDSYIEDTDSNRKERINKMKTRACILYRIMKTAIDFPIDEQINDPILGDSGAYGDSAAIGGQSDMAVPLRDFEGKSPDQLDFGRDYVENGCPNCGFNGDKNGNMYDITYPCHGCGEGGATITGEEKLNPAEPSLFGLPDGISPKEDLDSPSDEKPMYGTTDSGNTLYDKIEF